MHIERLPSGSYRYREYLNGQKVSITSKERLTKSEAIRLMSLKIESVPSNRPERASMTFEDAFNAYVDMKSSVLSPSTLRGYMSVSRSIPDWFKRMRLYSIEQTDIQKVINDYSVDHKPKSVKNVYGVICPVFASFRPSMNISCTLPQKVVVEPHIASEDDIKKLSDHFKDTDFEVAFTLGVFGLRRSEILAVTADSIKGNVLRVDSALVMDSEAKWVEKTTKTTSSTREIVIPQHIADKIKEQGYAYKGNANYLNTKLQKVEKKLGIEPFSFHKLRHFFASYCHNILHLSDEQIKKMGGWKDNSAVMRQVYAHSMRNEQTKQEVVTGLSKLL